LFHQLFGLQVFFYQSDYLVSLFHFFVSLEDHDFKNKKKIAKTKEVLEKLGAKVYVSKTTHFLKAFKKDNAIQEEEQDSFKIGDFKFDANARTLTHKNGEKVSLTPKETELLKVFASNPNQFVSRDGLLEKIWGESNYYNSRSMDVYITKLRDKLAGDKDVKLMTVHWKGFKLVLPKSKSQTTISEQDEIKDIVSQTEILKKATGKKLDAIIEYSNSVEGVSGIEVKEGATDKEKREAIADFYIKSAELEGENNQIANDLDEIIEDALADYVPKKKEEPKKEEPKKEEKKTGGNKAVLKKINDHFGFEDEEGEWFADTPIALTMADDKEFGEVIDKFTDYQVLSQSGGYKNDGSRATMLGCNVEYEIIPKGTADEDVEDNKKIFTIDNKTTIRDILTKLGSYEG
jgi:DNA-binding winged helix-turn-helix (wHTH) protein